MKRALVGGVIGAGVALGFLVYRKVGQMQTVIAGVEAATEGGPARSALAVRAAQVKTNIERFARVETERVASETAERYIYDRFGLTPDRIRRLEALF